MIINLISNPEDPKKKWRGPPCEAVGVGGVIQTGEKTFHLSDGGIRLFQIPSIMSDFLVIAGKKLLQDEAVHIRVEGDKESMATLAAKFLPIGTTITVGWFKKETALAAATCRLLAKQGKEVKRLSKAEMPALPKYGCEEYDAAMKAIIKSQQKLKKESSNRP